MDPRTWVAVGVVALAAAGGWFANGWRLKAELSALQATHERTIAQAGRDTLKAIEREQERFKGLQDSNATIDAAKTAELNEAKHELEKLRTGVANGAIGLRVAATCPARSGDLPARSPAPGVDDVASPELTADARQAYFALREAIDTMTKQLEGLQALEKSRSR